MILRLDLAPHCRRFLPGNLHHSFVIPNADPDLLFKITFLNEEILLYAGKTFVFDVPLLGLSLAD